MRSLSERLAAALAAIDRANADDPTRVAVRGGDWPLAEIHGRLATSWVARLLTDPGEAVLLAARAHHLRRWELPRASYPDGRAGYLRWRRDQKQRHANDVAALLFAAGYDAAEIERVQALIRRDGLAAGDAEAQVVEDAACLVFLETQFADFAARTDHDKLVTVVRKTATKMGPAALGLVTELPLSDADRQLIAAALS